MSATRSRVVRRDGVDHIIIEMSGLHAPSPTSTSKRALPTSGCAHCGPVALKLRTGAEMYPHRRDLAALNFWACSCGAYVGCHKGTTRPLGTAANSALRDLRHRAHAAFDVHWRKRGGAARSACYAWLADILGLTPESAHIGMLDAQDCRRLLNALSMWSPA